MRSLRLTFVFCALVPLLSLLTAGAARADDVVDEAWRMYLSADFEGALAAFDRAEAGALSRADYLRILEGRAQIHFALGDADAVRGALSRLASLSPEYRLSPETPPDLVDAFAETRQSTPRLTVDVTARRMDVQVVVSAEVGGDVGGLVRELRITGRVAGGTWDQAISEPLRLDAQADEAVEYYVEAVGPGGALLASEGSAERPRRLTADASGLIGDDSSDDGFLGIGVWGWVGIGAGVVAAAILTIVIVAVASSDATQPEAPVLP